MATNEDLPSIGLAPMPLNFSDHVLARKFGIVGHDDPTVVAQLVAKWLQTHDPHCTGQIEAITPITTPKGGGPVLVGGPKAPQHVVIITLRTVVSTPLEGATHETAHPQDATQFRADPDPGPAGGGSDAGPAAQPVPGLGDYRLTYPGVPDDCPIDPEG